MARLVIFDDRIRGVDLPDRAVIIGRSKKVDIPIHDGILSRKHCSIVPADSGFRLLDLKSQNGTYVNGERIEKTDLELDDIIEIGNTVLVFLDTETWERGEGLTRLRNPVKAQELIQRINRRRPVESAPPRELAEPALPAAAGDRPASRAGVDAELVADLVLHEHAKALVRADPRLRELVARTARRLREGPPAGADLAALRRRVRALVEEEMVATVAPPPTDGSRSLEAEGDDGNDVQEPR